MNYIPLVNIKQGTKSTRRYSNGNTLPYVQLPFAMCGFAAQTQYEGGWYFHPEHRCLEGVRLTHQPSPWISDYGTFLFTPQTGRIYDNFSDAWSGYKPEDAVMRPDYMKLRFLRSQTDFELTPSVRGGKIRLTFPEGRVPYLSLFPVKGNYGYEIDTQNNLVKAWTDGTSGGAAVDFKTYMLLKFDKPIDAEKSYFGEDSCVHIAFTDTIVTADVSSSYVSFEQAEENMKQDTLGKAFEDVRQNAEALWEEYLGRIEIETDDEKQLKTFYSCLYRTGLFPHKAYEIDKDGNAIHYCPSNGKITSGVRYTDNGFWDTYRSEFPLFALIAKEEYAEFMEGFIIDYTEGGWLPRWPSIGERGCMPSTLFDAIIADAAVKGIIGGKLLETALEGMLHHANVDSGHFDYGREGVTYYCKLGYVPKDLEFRETVNLSLDAAYGDFCIAKVAEVLGRDDIVDEYMARSKNYQKLFDKEAGFMRARNLDGTFDDHFDPYDWGGDYTEGSAWQNSFAVPHDFLGLAELYGGKDKLIAKLDELFAAEPKYNIGGYETEIHEMTEMAAVDFGQCAISNQPSFHIPYMYYVLGEKEKTEYWVEKLCKEAFSFEDDGFPGDEDNGATASWYVLGTLGIYDICPGKNEYIRIKKLVKSAKILGKKI